MILRSKPTIFGQHLTSEIGAPQDFITNKENGTFPDSYDLRVPGAVRPAGVNSRNMHEAKHPEHPASPIQVEETKHGAAEEDAQMRSASTSKASKPASEYMPIKHLN